MKETSNSINLNKMPAPREGEKLAVVMRLQDKLHEGFFSNKQLRND